MVQEAFVEEVRRQLAAVGVSLPADAVTALANKIATQPHFAWSARFASPAFIRDADAGAIKAAIGAELSQAAVARVSDPLERERAQFGGLTKAEFQRLPPVERLTRIREAENGFAPNPSELDAARLREHEGRATPLDRLVIANASEGLQRKADRRAAAKGENVNIPGLDKMSPESRLAAVRASERRTAGLKTLKLKREGLERILAANSESPRMLALAAAELADTDKRIAELEST